MKMILTSLALASTLMAYTLHNGATGPTQGAVTFPTATSLMYQHDGSETGPVDVLDSFQINADDGTNTGADAWIYVIITPVDNSAPVIASDTLTVAEGGNVTWSPSVTDADTP